MISTTSSPSASGSRLELREAANWDLDVVPIRLGFCVFGSKLIAITTEANRKANRLLCLLWSALVA